jgi:hypothetical protein
MTSILQEKPFVHCKYSDIAIDRDAGFVVKRVREWLDYGVFEREVYWLQQFANVPFVPNLIQFDADTKTMVTVFAGERLTRDNLPADWDHQIKTMILTLRALDCAHNDIKPSELLVLDGKLSLCDFAWATRYGAPIPPHWPGALGEEFALKRRSSFNDSFAIMKSICYVLENGEYVDAGGLTQLESAHVPPSYLDGTIYDRDTTLEAEAEAEPWVEHATEDEAPMQFCHTPNMFAGKLQYSESDDQAIVQGYQCYEIDAHSLRPLGGNFTSPKSELLLSYFQPANIQGKTVNDLGCANGFFSFAAMFAGAEKVTSVDMDADHLAQVESVKAKFGFDRIEPILSNVQDYNTTSDITICLALIHWIFSCTTFYGRFENCMSHLSELTRETLIIEWIDPSDTAIQNFGHINYNDHAEREEYNFENFLVALKQFFPNILAQHAVADTQTVYCVSK